MKVTAYMYMYMHVHACMNLGWVLSCMTALHWCSMSLSQVVAPAMWSIKCFFSSACCMNIRSVTLEEALVMACCLWRAFSTSLGEGGREEREREGGRGREREGEREREGGKGRT